MKKYLVGGATRDKLMGKQPKDFDFVCVLERFDKIPIAEISPFDIMVEQLEKEGFKIFLKSPEYFTVRAQFPKNTALLKSQGINPLKGLTADFVMARYEGPYSDGRRPDFVSPGTLEDDLSRRDLTVNAIAQDIETGEFIDPFGGKQDISRGVLRAVGDPRERMLEDSLRLLRALRFKIQLGFEIDPELEAVMFDQAVLEALRNVSDERKMDELNKMFKADSLESIRQLNVYGALTGVIFAGKVNLLATMKEKGFK